MKSRIASFALSDRMFWMCLPFTYCRVLILLKSDRYSAGALYFLSLSSFFGDLNRNTL